MSENAYVQWHADVARLVSERHPSAIVTHETQLGGGTNAVVVECGEDSVVVISDDALGIYSRAQWFGDEDEADGDFPFSGDMGTPDEAADRVDPHIVAAGC